MQKMFTGKHHLILVRSPNDMVPPVWSTLAKDNNMYFSIWNTFWSDERISMAETILQFKFDRNIGELDVDTRSNITMWFICYMMGGVVFRSDVSIINFEAATDFVSAQVECPRILIDDYGVNLMVGGNQGEDKFRELILGILSPGRVIGTDNSREVIFTRSSSCRWLRH